VRQFSEAEVKRASETHLGIRLERDRRWAGDATSSPAARLRPTSSEAPAGLCFYIDEQPQRDVGVTEEPWQVSEAERGPPVRELGISARRANVALKWFPPGRLAVTEQMEDEWKRFLGVLEALRS
jgi:hypothetical protein